MFNLTAVGLLHFLCPRKVSVSAMDLESASETSQGKDRTWEAQESLAGEPQDCMLTRAEKAEREPSGSAWPWGLASACWDSMCHPWPDSQASCLGFDPVAHTGLLERGSNSPRTASDSITSLSSSGLWTPRHHCYSHAIINLPMILAYQFTLSEPWLPHLNVGVKIPTH